MLRILFLDKEGGFGGSSRSLYFLIKSLDRNRIEPYVVLKERGPALQWYGKLGVRTFVMERLPVYKPSLRKNLLVLFVFLLRIGSFANSCRLLAGLISHNKIDIIHMNHDSFVVYGFFLRHFTAVKIVIHMRTVLPLNRFAAVQARCIERVADGIIFISENESKRYRELLCGRSGKGVVVFNSFETSEALQGTDSAEDSVFKVLYLGNLTYNKGADRLIDIARELRRMGRTGILFVVCGEDRGEKGGNSERAIESRAERAGVKPYFRFMGHQADPDRYLKEADVLIRLSRWNDPWGRDVIEAMACGKPVLATGTYGGFVENGVNGYLFSKYDARMMAESIACLSEQPELVDRMGKANVDKAKDLFDGHSNASKVVAVYESLVKHGRPDRVFGM